MDRKELIEKYVRFFESKGHVRIRSASLVPENDPTVLFTTAGMQPLIPYFSGEQTHPQGKRLVNVQRCVRTVDIEEVGDTCHHTLFEMLGHWSLGDYFKKEAIEYIFEFLTKVLEIPLGKLAFTVFAGDNNAPRDVEAANIWKSLGVSENRIAFLPKSENWWELGGETGPCGTDTEMFYWMPNGIPAPEKYNLEDSNWVEIGNNVLMAYFKNKDGSYTESSQKNIDFGGGIERIITTLDGLEDNYLIDVWKPIIEKIESISNKSYIGNEREMRIVADHIKAATFMIGDGVVPGNSEQGYILRRLIRRAIRSLRKIDVPILEMDATVEISKVVIELYDDYDILTNNKEKILSELKKEEDKFQKTLDKGLKEFEKMCSDEKIDAKESFLLYQSYGFPIELIKELADEKGISVDEKGFNEELSKHQELSRTASAGKFKSGLADNSDETKKLHTACHMLGEALRIVLKDKNIHQKGSNITPERLRFDFNFDRKLTSEEKISVENLVNAEIQKEVEVKLEEMTVDEAKASGAEGIFDSKYSEKVKVYSIGDFSKEICAGPHVDNTDEMGRFKIKKEESSSAGVRRIKAVLL
ncbi:alanine--tRNA ligase [Candidatus Pacearchaeota archaeon]|nr:alanine--tRNA ligase [Candidatus Pacearchaeota archaeon]